MVCVNSSIGGLAHLSMIPLDLSRCADRHDENAGASKRVYSSLPLSSSLGPKDTILTQTDTQVLKPITRGTPAYQQ